MDAAKNNRYAGKPLLRVLECYVLWAINKLSESEQAKLCGMELKLRHNLNQQGNWQEIIRKAMSLPENMPELIRENWLKNQGIAIQQNIKLDEQNFAEMFVDNNLT